MFAASSGTSAASEGLSARLQAVRDRIARACQRAGRPVSSVRLVAVTKLVPVELIREALQFGVTEVGENRVQEALDKRRQLAGAAARWHLIGHLQRNKARPAAELFDVVHSIDTSALAGELDRRAQDAGRRIEVFIQVNVSGEASKHGCRPEKVPELAEAVVGCGALALKGLMTIPPLEEDPEQARPHFRRLRELRDALAGRTARQPLELSMGMSHDVEVAVEEGADLVRIGTAIFGPRQEARP